MTDAADAESIKASRQRNKMTEDCAPPSSLLSVALLRQEDEQNKKGNNDEG